MAGQQQDSGALRGADKLDKRLDAAMWLLLCDHIEGLLEVVFSPPDRIDGWRDAIQAQAFDLAILRQDHGKTCCSQTAFVALDQIGGFLNGACDRNSGPLSGLFQGAWNLGAHRFQGSCLCAVGWPDDQPNWRAIRPMGQLTGNNPDKILRRQACCRI